METTVTYISGMIAPIISGIVTFPLDNLRKRMIFASIMSKKQDTIAKYSTIIEAVRNFYGESGYHGFYQGIGVTILNGVLGASVLTCYDIAYQMIRGRPSY